MTKLDTGGNQIERIRKLCSDLPEISERVSHGEPTFFTKRKVFVMFADNHHGDGHLAVWIPVPAGEQETSIRRKPDVFFRPPYVGVKGWVGIELRQIGDEELGELLQEAWRLISRRKTSSAASRI